MPYLSEITCTKRRVRTPALPFTAGNSSSSDGPNNEQPAEAPRPPPGLEQLEVGDGCGGAPVAPDVGSELKQDEPANNEEERFTICLPTLEAGATNKSGLTLVSSETSNASISNIRLRYLPNAVRTSIVDSMPKFM